MRIDTSSWVRLNAETGETCPATREDLEKAGLIKQEESEEKEL